MIRTASTMSTLTRTHCCHPCPSALVILRKGDWVFLLNGNQFGHWLVQRLTARTTQEGGINWWSRNYDRNICWMFQCGLLGYAWLSVGFKVQCMVQRLISVLKLGLGSINLEGMMSVFLQLERSEPTTWEVTSTQVQKHNLSTILSNQADSDLFSSSKAFVLNSNHSIRSFNTSISTCCLLR